MFVVMALQEYEFTIVGTDIQVKMDKNEKSIGCLPVYENKRDAENDYPGMPIAEVKFIKENPELLE